MENLPDIFKKSIYGYLYFFTGLLIPFVIFFILYFTNLGSFIIKDYLTHSVLCLFVIGFSLYSAYYCYKFYSKISKAYLLFFSLSTFVFAVIFFVHGTMIMLNGMSLNNEMLFEIAEHYSLFIFAVFCIGMILPFNEEENGFLYRNKKKIYFSVIAVLITIIIIVFFSNSIILFLFNAINFVVIFTGIILIALALFFVYQFAKTRNLLFLYFILGFTIIASSGYIPLLYKEFNLLWWYWHIVFPIGCTIIFVGFINYERKDLGFRLFFGEIPFYKKIGTKLGLTIFTIGLFPLLIFGFLVFLSIKDALSYVVFVDLVFRFMFIISLLLFVATFFSFYFIGKLILPLRKLYEATRKIAKGEEVYVEIKTGDETEVLANSFNTMSSELKRLHGGLESIINEQTKELNKKLLTLEEKDKAMVSLLEDAKIAKHHVAKEKDKMDAILHSIGDGVFVVDENFKVILINGVAAKMAGYKMEEILDTKYNDKLKFIFEDTGKINDQFINKAIETRTIQEMSNHTALVNNNGSKIPVSDSAAPLLNAGGKIIGCVVVFRDVTKEREVDKAKTEFVSLASHQLRTPLSAINWYTEMLMAGDAGDMNEEQKKYLGEVATGSKRMVDLVNALLNVSRLDLGTFVVEPESTNVVEMIKSVVNELKPQIIEKKLRVEELYGDSIPEFRADKKLLRMVFQNLLSNAAKYTPSEGFVRIELLVALKGQNFGGKNIKEDSITLKISDTGMGIPDKQKDKIFLKLFRADNARETETEGTGLGLYIVKSIIDNSEGLIWFESEENKGTTFYVVFPLSGMKKKEGTKKLD